MKRVLAAALTLFVMGLMIWTALRRSPVASTGSAEYSPAQDSQSQSTAEFRDATACIERLMAAAREGDVAAYLAAFGGSARARIEREADEIGRDAFAIRLRRASAARKGHAIFAAEAGAERRDVAEITVESAFADRIERQGFRLEQAHGGWLVTEVESARERVPKTALGTVATYDEPEGMPVAAGPDQPIGEETEN